MELFPDAVIKEPSWRVHGNKGKGGKRGKISTLSQHAAGRLREFLTTWHVPDREPWAVTLTIRRAVCPEEWRQLWHRFRFRLNEVQSAAVYRVELQRRKVPHIHAVAWVVPCQGTAEQLHLNFEQKDVWWRGWLNTITIPQADGSIVWDGAERKHASVMRPVENNGWAIYQAVHHGKSKREQLGWIGKQWGVIGRAFFRRRTPVQLELSFGQYVTLRRLVRRLLRARGARKTALPLHGRWVRCIDSSVIEKLVAWCKRAVPSSLKAMPQGAE